MTHPVVASLLESLPEVSVRRADLASDGLYHHASRSILVRHGLRGSRWVSTVVHEAIHAARGDEPCVDDASEARQELVVAKEAARRLIDVRQLAEAAAAYPDDVHQVADALHVDVETLVTRVTWLHPSERHYLRRRMAAATGEEFE